MHQACPKSNNLRAGKKEEESIEIKSMYCVASNVLKVCAYAPFYVIRLVAQK